MASKPKPKNTNSTTTAQRPPLPTERKSTLRAAAGTAARKVKKGIGATLKTNLAKAAGGAQDPKDSKDKKPGGELHLQATADIANNMAGVGKNITKSVHTGIKNIIQKDDKKKAPDKNPTNTKPTPQPETPAPEPTPEPAPAPEPAPEPTPETAPAPEPASEQEEAIPLAAMPDPEPSELVAALNAVEAEEAASSSTPSTTPTPSVTPTDDDNAPSMER